MIHPQRRSIPQPGRGRRGGAPFPAAAPSFAVALASLAFLLFCWPFAMSPAPSLETGTWMVFAAWSAVVGALWLVTRALGRGASGPDQDA